MHWHCKWPRVGGVIDYWLPWLDGQLTNGASAVCAEALSLATSPHAKIAWEARSWTKFARSAPPCQLASIGRPGKNRSSSLGTRTMTVALLRWCLRVAWGILVCLCPPRGNSASSNSATSHLTVVQIQWALFSPWGVAWISPLGRCALHFCKAPIQGHQKFGSAMDW
jgi:hypothetical protein